MTKSLKVLPNKVFRFIQPTLISRRRQLVEMRTAEKNRRERARGKALTDIEAHLEYLDNCLEKLNQEIEKLTQANQQWPEKVNLLKTVPGIGQVISTTLVSDLPELGQLTAKQISRLVGVAPINPDSGQHKGKRMIQGGRAQIRATLYMGAVVAMGHNPVIKAFYERLVGGGKSKKLAVTACVRKILVILNAMVRQNQPWQQQTIYHLVPRDSHFLLSLIKGCAGFGLT
ncbi:MULTISPECIES: transposase [unclassified Microcystis]|nr:MULTISPECIES: transposase [unclassified Microcystis]